MVFNVAFANNIILLCFFVFFEIIDVYFLNHVVNLQIFNPTAECAITIGTYNNEAYAEIETHTLATETKTTKMLKLIEGPACLLCFSLVTYIITFFSSKR